MNPFELFCLLDLLFIKAICKIYFVNNLIKLYDFFISIISIFLIEIEPSISIGKFSSSYFILDISYPNDFNIFIIFIMSGMIVGYFVSFPPQTK